MGRRILLLGVICAALLSARCSSGRLPGEERLNPENVLSLELLTGSVPASLVCKRTADPDAIEKVLEMVNGAEIEREAVPDDITAGGVGLFLQLWLKDGGVRVVHIGGNGDVLDTGRQRYKIQPIDEEAVWSAFSAPEEEQKTRWELTGVVTAISEDLVMIQTEDEVPGWDSTEDLPVDIGNIGELKSIEIVQKLAAGDIVQICYFLQMVGPRAGSVTVPLDSVYELRILKQNR